MTPVVVNVTEDRYTRELRRVQLAQRLLRHHVRQSWVEDWTGCSQRRVRSLDRFAKHRRVGKRGRGPLPSKPTRVLSTAIIRSEASAIAGLAYRFGMLPEKPVKEARKVLPGLALGEQLCWLYDVYREWVPDAVLTLERFLVLFLELAEQRTLHLSRCENCNGFWVVDKLDVQHRRCMGCEMAGRSRKAKSPLVFTPQWSVEPEQRSLF